MSDPRDMIIPGGAREPLEYNVETLSRAARRSRRPDSSIPPSANGSSDGRGAGVSTRSSSGNGESSTSGARRASMAAWIGQSSCDLRGSPRPISRFASLRRSSRDGRFTPPPQKQKQQRTAEAQRARRKIFFLKKYS